jgi:hypothetical protein
MEVIPDTKKGFIIMSDDLQFIFMITIISILFIYAISSKHNKDMQERERPPKDEPKPKKPSKRRTHSDEIIDTLDWMLMNSIITKEEYTKLMGKCLPFLG